MSSISYSYFIEVDLFAHANRCSRTTESILNTTESTGNKNKFLFRILSSL